MLAVFTALSLAVLAPSVDTSRPAFVPQNGFVRLQPSCLAQALRVADIKAPAFKKLRDLPDADLEIAMIRLDIEGCPKPVIVSYQVSR